MYSQLSLFDTHCHLDFSEFSGKLTAMLQKAQDTGVCGFLIPGVKRDGWRRIRQIAAQHKLCHTALGLHPMFTNQHQESDLHDLEMALSVGPIAAIGEVGLDFYHKDADRELQTWFFEAQAVIASEARLPLVLHVRKAHDQVLKILHNTHFKEGGIVHAFNGSEVQAARYMELGFKLGFGGAMTFPRAAKLHKLAAKLPLSAIVIETDAPDMPPITCKLPFNTPLHIFDNFRSLISLRRETALEIGEQTTRNAFEVLRLEPGEH